MPRYKCLVGTKLMNPLVVDDCDAGNGQSLISDDKMLKIGRRGRHRGFKPATLNVHPTNTP